MGGGAGHGARAGEDIDEVGAVRIAHPGLGVVGAWVSGTGLAQVIPDALTESERVRAALLWDRRP